jgi:hypothetical protein
VYGVRCTVYGVQCTVYDVYLITVLRSCVSRETRILPPVTRRLFVLEIAP